MKMFVRALLPFLIAVSGMVGANAADRAIVVLDASGSMWGQIDGKPKLEIARETLKSVLQTIPADMELGLMAYGHREKGSCDDIELVVPPAKGTAGAISAAADSMKFLGKTPLSAAVKKAAEDLKYTEDKATVILITDGLETCNADPCAVGKELEQSGVDFTAHVVGFGLTAEEGKQVACLAENTGGKYIQANDAAALEDALKVTVAEPAPVKEPAPEPEPEPAKETFNFIPKTVLSPAGETPPIDVMYEIFKKDPGGQPGERVVTEYNAYKGNLEAGDYIVSVRSGEAKLQQDMTIEAGKVLEPTFVLNAGALILRARPAPGADIDGDAQIIIDFPGDGESFANYGEVKTVVPAGDQKITVKLGAGELTETIPVAAGQTVEKDLIVGVGQAIANAFYAAGGEKIESGDLTWKIFKAAKKLDGSREQVGYEFGPGKQFDLPAGDYVASATMQAATAEAPFTVAVGASQDVSVVMNAGVVAISAPGAESFRIYEAKKNLQGERQEVTVDYGEKMQTTMIAGDYVVVTKFSTDKADSETPFTVKAGERSEVAVP